MSESWDRLFACDKCGQPLAIKLIKGHQVLVTVGKCPSGHAKKFNLSLANLKEWAPPLKNHFIKCVKCDSPTSLTPIHKGAWVKLIVTCPVHGKNDTRILPSSVYSAMTQDKTQETTKAPSPEAIPGPACQYCGQNTTFIPQYSRYFCYNCQRYAEDKNVMEKVRAPSETNDLKAKLLNHIATLEKNFPYSFFDFPTQMNMPTLDSSKIESLLQEMILHGEVVAQLDSAMGEITFLEAPAVKYVIDTPQAASASKDKICPRCGSDIEYIEAKEAYFCKICFDYVEAAVPTPPSPFPGGELEALRDFDYVGGQVRFKVAVRNKASLVTTNIGVELDIPPEFKLVRILPDASLDDLDRALAKVDKLMPKSSQGIDFYLEPVSCGTGVISGIAKYQDAQGNFQSVPIKKKEVAIKCPLIFTPEEANIAMIRNLMNSLNNDYRRWALPITPPDSFKLLHDLINQYQINHIQAFQISGDPYQVESWYYTRAKTTNHPIALRINVSELTNTMDLTIACENMAELTGLLAKISEDFVVKVQMKLNLELKPAFGNLKELLCECGSPLSRLPSETEEVTCNSCQKMYTWDALD